MDKSQLHKIFSKSFRNNDWLDVLQNVFGAKQLLVQPREILLPNNNKANAAFELGNFTTSDDRIIGLYRIELNPDVWLERNKVGLRELLRNIYKYDVDGAIIVFDQGEKWRLSFVSEIKVLNDEGEIIEQATEPKRYTYLLGQDEKVKTPSERLSKLAGKPLALNDILEAFSVEALNEEFYKIVAEYFYQLIGGKIGKGKKGKDYGDGILKLPNVPKENHQVYQEFTVRLIGRTVFCWFLKVKKGDNEESLLPEKLLSSKAVKDNTGYYHSVLERLFFQTLNTRMKKRVDNLPNGCEQIPFLNGGLFEPGSDDYYRANQISGLSENLNTLQIEDNWFLNFFQELEKYNFTIDENSVTDVEVSVDPEMLGRIFENLLAEIDPDSGETARKATGSFYTPREIVDYMATESLVQYLHNKTGIKPKQLRPVFKMIEQAQPTFSDAELEDILDALDKVKILDPACGSGAFPMGVLQKIVMALQKLDPESEWWKKRQLKRITNPIIKKALREKLNASSVEYARKIGIIQNSLYGVDIQPIAAEISKLRCFLTLIVDENINDSLENRGIEPLPNLEFKFVTADTLVRLPKEEGQAGLFDNFEEIELLTELREEYLQSSGKKKIKIKERFIRVQNKILKSHNLFTDKESRTYKQTTWNPFGHVKADWFDPKWMYGVDSFDVVIGNPPYVQMQKDKGVLANKYKNEGYNTYERTGDVYSLFYERGFQLLSKKSILCYITSNQWMRAKYGESLREHFLEKNPLILINLGPGVFQSATVDTNILIAENIDYKNDFSAINIIKGSQINHLTKSDMQQMLNLDKGRWSIDTREEAYISQKIFKKGRPLKDWNITINRGLLTGFNEAFIIPQKIRDELVNQDSTSVDIIKPILKGKDINKFSAKKYESHLIVSHNGYKSENGEIVNRIEVEKDYPTIWNWLQGCEQNSIEAKLINPKKNTVSSRSDQGQHWTNLRNCAYYEDFQKEKVIWKRIGSSLRFSYSNEEIFCLDSTCIATGEKIKYLTAYLNSKLAHYQLFKSAPKTGMGDLIISVQALNPLLVYYPNNQQEKQFNTLVDYIIFLLNTDEQINSYVPNSHLVQLFEEIIDAMVMELYFEEDFKKLNVEFIKYVERDFKSIQLLNIEKHKVEIIEIVHQSYQILRKKDNELRNNLKLMDIKLADIVMPIKIAK